jgi:hypothetical protein
MAPGLGWEDPELLAPCTPYGNKVKRLIETLYGNKVKRLIEGESMKYALALIRQNGGTFFLIVQARDGGYTLHSAHDTLDEAMAVGLAVVRMGVQHE